MVFIDHDRTRSAMLRFPTGTQSLVKAIFHANPERVAEKMQGDTYVSFAKQKEILTALMKAHIENEVYVRLAPRMLPDGTHIIGVVAIRDIPAGAYPFKTLLGHCFAENPLVEVPKDAPEVAAVRSFLDEFFLGADKYPLPLAGPNSINASYFLNHSATPNVAIVRAPGGECDYSVYQTSRAIAAGEELTIDYRHFIHPNPKRGMTWDTIQRQLDPQRVYLESPVGNKLHESPMGTAEPSAKRPKRSSSHTVAGGKSSRAVGSRRV